MEKQYKVRCVYGHQQVHSRSELEDIIFPGIIDDIDAGEPGRLPALPPKECYDCRMAPQLPIPQPLRLAAGS